jgi:hypothetical protein
MELKVGLKVYVVGARTYYGEASIKEGIVLSVEDGGFWIARDGGTKTYVSWEFVGTIDVNE